jgi:hypothetical protein
MSVIDWSSTGADGRQSGHRAYFGHFAAEVMQHVELMDRELRSGPPGALSLPPPCRGVNSSRAFAGEIGLDERDTPELAGVDAL